MCPNIIQIGELDEAPSDANDDMVSNQGPTSPTRPIPKPRAQAHVPSMTALKLYPDIRRHPTKVC